MISRIKSLGEKAEKIRQLVEQFSIGLIIFDEIQLIDFATANENSFESLMVLTNRTKVAIGVVGTTDAYAKMFTNLRTARRVGAHVSASQYCKSREYFSFLVHQLFHYQWFDTVIEVTEQIIDALYENTHGIIDQLVSLYTCMHIEYLSKKRRPQVNADFINRVAQKYYPQMKELLETIDDPQCEEKIHDLLQQAHINLEAMQDKAQQEFASKEIIASQTEAYDTELLEKNVLRNITSVSDDYSADSIHSAFVKVMSKNKGLDEKAVTKAVFSLLQKGPTVKRPRRKQTNKIPHATMLNDILTTSA